MSNQTTRDLVREHNKRVRTRRILDAVETLILAAVGIAVLLYMTRK